MSFGWILHPFITKEKYLGTPVAITGFVFFFVLILPVFVLWKYFDYVDNKILFGLFFLAFLLSIMFIKKSWKPSKEK